MTETTASPPSDPDRPLGSEHPDRGVRVRFCPSPTGTPHVGLIRTALFNWAYARHTGGRFVVRIEDTDAARDSEQSYHQLLDALRWLRLDWDEGVEVGGPHGPYRQSERGATYAEVIERLRSAGYLYESFSDAGQIEARHRAAGRDPKLGYDNADRDTADADRQRFLDAGRRPVLRFRMPSHDLVVEDLVRGPVRFPAGSVPDFVVLRADGSPLYALVNAVDDALMGITHVLRGEDLLSSTPRQLALWEALVDLGLAEAPPDFGHLPYVTGEGNRKLSKRDPQADLFLHRNRGFLPEGLTNYLALLGWSIAEDRDVFSMAEMCAAFEISDVNANPARFDQRKAEAINAEHVRRLEPEDFRARLIPYLQNAGVLPDPPSASQLARLASAAPLIQTRIQLLGEAPGLLGFLFVPDAMLEPDADAVAGLARDEVARTGALAVLAAAAQALEALGAEAGAQVGGGAGNGDWETGTLEAVLRSAVVDGLGLKPKLAFGPLRVAITGRRISPPLFESMEILGRDACLTRLAALRDVLAGRDPAARDLGAVPEAR